MYIVMCQVSGGMTGTRQAVLKSRDEVLYFGSETEARLEALRLDRKMNGPHATANFRYWPVTVEAAQAEGYQL
jgi:hypothetical protein